MFVPEIHHTKNGTPYLKEPGVALVAHTTFIPEGPTPFIEGFGDEFDAEGYEDDWFENGDDGYRSPDGRNAQDLKLDDGAALCKFAGQLCYLSFSERRTRNSPEEVKRYFDNIKSSGHGSVLEHASYSMLVWGVDRAFSHEMVRHRAGWGYSQLSQRYVSGRTLRFVERPEYQSSEFESRGSEALHQSFEDWIDAAKREYDKRAQLLLSQLTPELLEAMTSTERRKAVNSAARNCLPNETETAMVLTGNVRAWRHVLEMRASPHADVPIRQVALRAWQILRAASPALFDDYELRGDATPESPTKASLATPHRKV